MSIMAKSTTRSPRCPTWGVGWGVLGFFFPVLTPAIGAAQGFGKCKYKCGGVGRARKGR